MKSSMEVYKFVHITHHADTACEENLVPVLVQQARVDRDTPAHHPVAVVIHVLGHHGG